MERTSNPRQLSCLGAFACWAESPQTAVRCPVVAGCRSARELRPPLTTPNHCRRFLHFSFCACCSWGYNHYNQRLDDASGCVRGFPDTAWHAVALGSMIKVDQRPSLPAKPVACLPSSLHWPRFSFTSTCSVKGQGHHGDTDALKGIKIKCLTHRRGRRYMYFKGKDFPLQQNGSMLVTASFES